MKETKRREVGIGINWKGYRERTELPDYTDLGSMRNTTRKQNGDTDLGLLIISFSIDTLSNL